MRLFIESFFIDMLFHNVERGSYAESIIISYLYVTI